MRFFIGIIIFIVLATIESVALPVVVHGKSAAGDAFVFRAYVQKDPISGLEELVDQTRPDADGRFMLGFEAQHIQKLSIKVGLQNLTIFVQPGKTYHLNFTEISLEDQNVFLPGSPLKVEFEQNDMLNLIIDGFEYSYQDFVQNQFIELIKYRDKRIYELFEQSVYKKLIDTPIEDTIQKFFIETYIDYRLADLRLSARLEERNKIGVSMIDEMQIQLNNPAYAQFFMKYFDKYFLEYNGGNIYSQVQKSLSIGSSSKGILDEMGQDPVLAREQIRELVFVYSLKQIYYNRQISKSSINEILKYLGQQSKFEWNREVASNLYKTLLAFQPGYPVPEFYLTNQNGIIKSLSDYKGKYVYLMFISPNCETCETDIRLLKALENEYSDKLQILSIFAGYDFEEASYWVKSQKANWDFLWFNDDFGLLNDFKVKNFPKYLLLDDKGNLLHYFPPKPREDFMSLIKALNERDNEVKQESSDFFRKN